MVHNRFGGTLTALALRKQTRTDEDLTLVPRPFPQIMKYMGSKTGIIGFVAEGLHEAYRGGPIYDLFAGSASLSGAFGHLAPIVSNDVQAYSGIVAGAYLWPASAALRRTTSTDLIARAGAIVAANRKGLPPDLDHSPEPTILSAFNAVEERNRALLGLRFERGHHLFLKDYAGTWWSSEQCLWIDALRELADGMLAADEITPRDHGFLIACAIYAMSYCSQGTGHYAQYRDAKTDSAMKDIGALRSRSVPVYFMRKFDQLLAWNIANATDAFAHDINTLDFKDCLEKLDGGVVYADPPYNFAHYSRFYHAAETFVRYDYPMLQSSGGRVVKGRYREDRHQSPFSIRSLVAGAFASMFAKVRERGANLVLSYSEKGLMPLPDVIASAHENLGGRYAIALRTTAHTHMTMGRSDARSHDIAEKMLVAVRR